MNSEDTGPPPGYRYLTGKMQECHVCGREGLLDTCSQCGQDVCADCMEPQMSEMVCDSCLYE